MAPDRRALAALMGLSCLALLASGRPPLIAWNATASAPAGPYLVLAWRRPVIGELALVRPEPVLAAWMAARGYLGPATPLLKPVAATAGASVCRRGQQLLVDGRPVAAARTRDRAGRPLPAWSGCRRLAADEILLLGDHPDSLDGRYFGATRRGRLVGVARPLRRSAAP